MRGIYSFVRVSYFVGLYNQWEHWPRMFCAIVIEQDVVQTDEQALSLFYKVKNYLYETQRRIPNRTQNRKQGETKARSDGESDDRFSVLGI